MFERKESLQYPSMKLGNQKPLRILFQTWFKKKVAGQVNDILVSRARSGWIFLLSTFLAKIEVALANKIAHCICPLDPSNLLGYTRQVQKWSS